MKDAPDVSTTTTAASKTLTAPDAVKDSAPSAGTGTETTVPKKKAKKSNADKGVVIVSDNPSGPPLDDVSFLHVPFGHYFCCNFSRMHFANRFSYVAADNSGVF